MKINKYLMFGLDTCTFHGTEACVEILEKSPVGQYIDPDDWVHSTVIYLIGTYSYAKFEEIAKFIPRKQYSEEDMKKLRDIVLDTLKRSTIVYDEFF